ncbi:GNAT family N-acetyltransferase [Prosthecomicrobium sp. N25]|uniref:GNAT family N-acetyltransferase n=1 Tax=Prosthecomicrobium sp. N25 TaxID=3129254 RepID=UPI003077AD2A
MAALSATAALTRAPASDTTARDSLVAERLDTLEAIEALRPDWEALERRCSRPVLFQSAAWSMHAARHHAGRDGSAPLVVAVRRRGELIAVAPLRVVRQGPVRLAVELGAPFGQYGDILAADDADGEAVARAVLDALFGGAAIDGLVLRRMRADSPLRAPLMARGFAIGSVDAAPYVDLAAAGGFEPLLKTLSTKSRKNLRNQRNRLARIATRVEHRIFSPAALREALAVGFEKRLQTLEEKGLTSTAFMDPGFRAFVDGLPDAPGLEILAMGLMADEVPISVQWGFLHQGRYYAYITARDPGYDEVSPGKLHLEDIMRVLSERGVATADLLAPAVPYKFLWTDSACEVVDVAVPFGIVGRFWLDGWSRRLRPRLRDAFLALPARIRQPIARRLARHAAAEPSASGPLLPRS